MLKICQRYVKDMPKICQRYAKDTPKICQRYAKDTPKICQRYAKDSPKIQQRYTKLKKIGLQLAVPRPPFIAIFSWKISGRSHLVWLCVGPVVYICTKRL